MKWNSENREEFFAYIEKLIDEDKYTECITALENIPMEERDYKVWYQLARTYQNFAIVGNDDKGTPSFIGDKFLLKSIDILNSVREEGKDKAEWNMRMAYAYQYLTHEEEKAIPYALRWAELDSEEQNALEVVKECKEEIEKRECRVNVATEKVIDQETAEIDEDWCIYLCNAFAYDLPAVVRTNLALINFEFAANYPKRLELQILYKNADDNGFYSREEEEYLYDIEDAVVEIIEKHGDILAGVVECDERSHIVAYAKNELGYYDEISEMMAEKFPDYAYTFAAFEDEDWDMYFDALYPDRYEYQSIMNRWLIEDIKSNGDSMVPRVLEHCLCFTTEENGEAFLTKVMEDGFTKLSSENLSNNEAIDKKHPYELVIGREDAFENIDETVWYLMDLAEEFDGEYDGWACHIVK
ncbi:DUF695 domain-containing protein [Streptococcus sp. SPS1]|uniref:DUF695 domain-containing protein n=1 Tax=Streptococcus sp. SPS1 TaxID=3018247 RepID=UPI00263E74FA|nr:DUF695 domain-containing protein [Streptococcus sp. SPS1]MDN5027369.1 DUF695 domain-containing protein [Streptococcus sp. SPS1]